MVAPFTNYVNSGGDRTHLRRRCAMGIAQRNRLPNAAHPVAPECPLLFDLGVLVSRFSLPLDAVGFDSLEVYLPIFRMSTRVVSTSC